MGNYEELKQAVYDVIKTNGNQEITGAILQNALLTIISTIGSNATFAGVAKTDTNPGTPDQNVFYIATEPGIYANFNSVLITEVSLIVNDGGNWSVKKLNISFGNEYNCFSQRLNLYSYLKNKNSVNIKGNFKIGDVIKLELRDAQVTAEDSDFTEVGVYNESGALLTSLKSIKNGDNYQRTEYTFRKDTKEIKINVSLSGISQSNLLVDFYSNVGCSIESDNIINHFFSQEYIEINPIELSLRPLNGATTLENNEYGFFIPVGSTGYNSFFVNTLKKSYYNVDLCQSGLAVIVEVDCDNDNMGIFSSVYWQKTDSTRIGTLSFNKKIGNTYYIGAIAIDDINNKISDLTQIRFAFQLKNNNVLDSSCTIKIKKIYIGSGFETFSFGGKISERKIAVDIYRNNSYKLLEDTGIINAQYYNGAEKLAGDKLGFLIPNGNSGDGSAFTRKFENIIIGDIINYGGKLGFIVDVEFVGDFSPYNVGVYFQKAEYPYTAIGCNSHCRPFYYENGTATYVCIIDKDEIVAVDNMLRNFRIAMQINTGEINVVGQDVEIKIKNTYLFAINNEYAERQINDLINPYEKSILSVENINKTGIYFGSMSKFSGSLFYPIIVSIQNAASNSDSVLSKIEFYSYKQGKIKFAVGEIDQRNWAIIDYEFYVDAVVGKNVVDVLSKNYVIGVGKQLFVYTHETGLDDETVTYKTKTITTQNDPEMIYGRIDGEVDPIPGTEYGASVSLYYETVEISSIFAFKNDFNSLNETVGNLSEQTKLISDKINIVNDRQGLKYKLLVQDGAVIAIPVQFKKVLVISNSYGKHSPVYSYGWCAERGMATSVDGNDFVSFIRKGIQEKDPEAEVYIAGVAKWERDFSFDKNTLLEDKLFSDTDCIIFRCGENVSDVSGFKNAIIDMMQYCFSIATNSIGYICSMLFSNSGKDEALLQAANEMSLDYINCISNNPVLHKQKSGFYTRGWVTNDGGATWDKEQTKLYPILYSGVAGHPNDVGMLYMANNILSAISYPELNVLHDVNVVDNGILYTTFEKWVENGILSIKTDANSVTAIKDANAEQIAVTNQGDGVYTLEMPNDNITITLNE